MFLSGRDLAVLAITVSQRRCLIRCKAKLLPHGGNVGGSRWWKPAIGILWTSGPGPDGWQGRWKLGGGGAQRGGFRAQGLAQAAGHGPAHGRADRQHAQAQQRAVTPCCACLATHTGKCVCQKEVSARRCRKCFCISADSAAIK